MWLVYVIDVDSDGVSDGDYVLIVWRDTSDLMILS